MAPALFQIDPRDSVATALRDLDAGERHCGVIVAEPVARGHKVALRAIAAGETVIKFGFPIGRATREIAPGAHVHSHNLATALAAAGRYDYRPEPHSTQRGPNATFEGYRRADGRVGTRNEIWVIPTVGCVARTAQKIAARAAARHEGRVDGVHAFPHPFGCSQLGDDLAGTRSLLASLASHPNAGGVLIVGLGCESNQMKALRLQAEQVLRDAQANAELHRAEARFQRHPGKTYHLYERAPGQRYWWKQSSGPRVRSRAPNRPARRAPRGD